MADRAAAAAVTTDTPPSTGPGPQAFFTWVAAGEGLWGADACRAEDCEPAGTAVALWGTAVALLGTAVALLGTGAAGVRQVLLSLFVLVKALAALLLLAAGLLGPELGA